MWGSPPCFCSSTPSPGQPHSLSSTFPSFSSSFQAVEWIHVFLSSGQGILPLFSWHSVRNAASINVFMRHPWWQMDFMFTYSSAILLTPIYVCLRKEFQFLLTLVTPHTFIFCVLKKNFHFFRLFQFHKPLQYSHLENPMEGGAWWAAAHGVATSQTWLSDFTFNFHFPLSCIGEGNDNSLQCSCLENPRDGGAWWAAVYGVAQSQTQLKQ